MNKKILNTKDIVKKIKLLKKNKKKIILCHGVFDLLHLGHIQHFQKAKKLGDILIVSTTTDKFVNKGFGKPYFNLSERQEALSSIKFIDFIVPSDFEDARGIIKVIQPDIYCKGIEFKNFSKDISGKIKFEEKEIKKYGGKIAFVSGKVFSSSSIVNNKTDVFNEDIKKFIKTIKRKYDFKTIQDVINNYEDLNVLVIGETIIDTYSNCEVMGKSGKEPHLVLKERSVENYIGGAASVANYVSKFVKNTTFISSSGTDRSSKILIEKNLNKKINKKIIYDDNIRSIIKKRYIDQDNTIKVLGVYRINDNNNVYKKSQELIFKYLDKNIKKYDLVILCDYGHGLLNEKIIKILFKNKKYTAVNSQINSSNINYFTLEKFKKSNYLIINEREFRFEMKDQTSKLDHLIKLFHKKYQVKNLVVTRGKYGSVFFNGKNFIYCPAFANKIIDKVGAGDSFFSLFSLGIIQEEKLDIALLIGSIAGAHNIENIANSKKLDKKYLLKYIDHLLK